MVRHWERDSDLYPVAEFIDPWLGDKVNSGLGLSYRNARLYMAGRYDNPMPELILSPSLGSLNSATGGEKGPQKSEECIVMKCLMFSFDGFSCSLDVVHTVLQFLIIKIIFVFFNRQNFTTVFLHGPALKPQCVSTTQLLRSAHH